MLQEHLRDILLLYGFSEGFQQVSMAQKTREHLQMEIKMNLCSVWERAIAGIDWLIEQQEPDGGWKILDNQEVDAHYKTSWAFLAMGHPDAAQRNLNLIQRNMLQENGNFAPRLDPWHKEVHHLYANAYIIIGAMAAGRYEIAYPAGRFLLSQQDQRHGGFYSMSTEKGQRNRCDTMSTSAAGIACLAAGQIEAARRAADFLIHIVQTQPTPSDYFYTCIEADGTLGIEPEDESQRFWRVIDTHADNQCWYALGLPFAFLVQMAEATQEARYRDAAQSYFTFQEKCTGPWDGPSSGKAAWACSMLYRKTGEKKYRDIALHVASYFISLQETDGNWILTGSANDSPKIVKNLDVDATAELTLWLSLIAANIASRESTRLFLESPS